MKRFPLIAIFSLLTLINCDERPNQKLIPQSSGNINTLLVVIDNLLWDDSVGEGIREAFAAPVQGLTNEEPIFSISQMPTSVFSGFATKNRIVLKIDKGSPAGVAFHKDALAIPQTMVVISGNTNQEIIDQIEANADTIIATFKKEEIKEKQRRIKLSLHDTKAIQEQLGINIDFPTVYRIATHSDNFFWIRKDIITGNMDL